MRRHSQVVRQRSAKPPFPGSNPGVALIFNIWIGVKLLQTGHFVAVNFWPLYPEWADAWELQNRILPPLELENGYTNAQLGTKTSNFFERRDWCYAYDLRHCYARCCLEFGFSPEFGAKMMGHSPETHCRVYRR